MRNDVFQIVVRAIIKDRKSKVLLVKRARNPDNGKWALPGGKVEFGEEYSEAIKREVREELGLDFIPGLYFIKTDSKSVQGVHCLVIYIMGGYQGEIKVRKEEISKCKFFSMDDINNSLNVGFDHKEILLQNSM